MLSTLCLRWQEEDETEGKWETENLCKIGKELNERKEKDRIDN